MLIDEIDFRINFIDQFWFWFWYLKNWYWYQFFRYFESVCFNWFINICSLPDQSRCYDDYRSKRRWTYMIWLFTWILKEEKDCIWENWSRSCTFQSSSYFYCQQEYACLSYQKWRFSLWNYESLEEEIHLSTLNLICSYIAEANPASAGREIDQQTV